LPGGDDARLRQWGAPPEKSEKGGSSNGQADSPNPPAASRLDRDCESGGTGDGLTLRGIGVALEALEISAQLGGGLATDVAIFFEAFEDDLFEFGGDFVMYAGRRNGSAIEDVAEDDPGSFAAKGSDTGGHFVQHDTEGKEVGTRIERFAADLFRGHISDRANGAARTGKELLVDGAGFALCDRGGTRGIGICGYFREAEIENFGVAEFGDKDIGGLDVAMNDAAGVSGLEAGGDVDGNVEEFIGIERLVTQEMLESEAIEKFHGDESLAVLLTDIVNGADIRMIEGGSGLRFALEAGEGLWIEGDFGRKEFEGDKAVQAGVFGFVDNAHATTAEFFEDAVVREDLATEWLGGRHVGTY